MNRNRNYIFITITSIALLIVLIIQVNWIFETAKIKEEMFNDKAKLILSRTTEDLLYDQVTCKKIGACMDKDSILKSTAKIGKDPDYTDSKHILDSIFNHYMKLYNFHIDYTYEIIKSIQYPYTTDTSWNNYVHDLNLNQDDNNEKLEIKLIFPDKKKYIIAEMGTQFITTVILILIVLILSWRTILSLMKEKKISEHTAEFLNNMTHEFKTPLTNIALAGKMILKDSTINEDKIKHYSGIILEENEKLRLQVEQVLSMNALERGEIPIHKAILDFHELINDSLKCMSIQIESKEGAVKLNLAAERSLISGDKSHLTNAMCNLIDNAIKYSKDKPELSIQTSNNGPDLIVIITDNGIGIDKEYHKKVFDKFFRVPTGDVHDIKGFGLGLAYIKRIINLHGGTIDLRSEKDKGTSFIITIPYV